MSDLRAFVTESNRIEGIVRDPWPDEIEAHVALLALGKLTVADIEAFVSAVQPDAKLRNRVGMNARVGNHLPPLGGRDIEVALMSLLGKISKRQSYPTPFNAHRTYEELHPFTDGNGRSGRAIWLWQMQKVYNYSAPLGFLHTWYYQSLEDGDA